MVKNHTRGKAIKAIPRHAQKAKKHTLKQKAVAPAVVAAAASAPKAMEVERPSKLKKGAGGLVDRAKLKMAKVARRREAKKVKKARAKAGPAAPAKVDPDLKAIVEAPAQEYAKLMAKLAPQVVAAKKAADTAMVTRKVPELTNRDRKKRAKFDLKTVRTKTKIANQSRSGSSSRGGH
mmetsp:Transcript_106185/g.269721  ORF Transcript_106185/g.269721 Transcript_106185/m.269721 type:complete len:178 (+) Transcript_106185:59-592(+)